MGVVGPKLDFEEHNKPILDYVFTLFLLKTNVRSFSRQGLNKFY